MKNTIAPGRGSSAPLAGPSASVRLSSDRPEAVYKIGETAIVEAEFFDGGGSPVESGEALVAIRSNYQGPEAAQRIVFSKERPLRIEVKSDAGPGFSDITVRYPADAAAEPAAATIGLAFSPEKLAPQYQYPADFREFWAGVRAKLAAVPLDPRLEKLDDYSNDAFTAYRVSFANVGSSRIHGFMTVPNGEGPYPVFVTVPGSGPRELKPVSMAEVDNANTITMVMNVFPFALPFEYDQAEAKINEYYKSSDPLGYWSLPPELEDYIFYRAIPGIDRAFDYAAAHPKADGKHMVYWGSSQGGAMGTVLAALNGHITAAVVNVPGDFAKPFSRSARPELARYAGYFANESFARDINIPFMASAGLIDMICNGNNISRFFNLIPAAGKQIRYVPGMGHAFDDEYQKMTADFIRRHLAD